MNNSEEFLDAKEAIVDCVFKFIDRMNDVCDQDPADRIVQQFTEKMNPLIEEYIECKFAPHKQHRKFQIPFEFRTSEEIAKAEEERKCMLRSTKRSLRK